MRVLIADFDLFRAVGGGQTFYRAIIEKNPQINFFYLTIKEAADAHRAANAHPIRYECEYLNRQWTHYCDILPPRWSLSAFLLASNLAWSVRGREFDVVDLPDYQQFGYFLPAALAHHRASRLHRPLDARRRIHFGKHELGERWAVSAFVGAARRHAVSMRRHSLRPQRKLPQRVAGPLQLAHGVSESATIYGFARAEAVAVWRGAPS